MLTITRIFHIAPVTAGASRFGAPGTLQLWPTELVRPLLFVDRREVLEPSTGFEPALSAWKAEVLPLHHDGISPGYPGLFLIDNFQPVSLRRIMLDSAAPGIFPALAEVRCIAQTHVLQTLCQEA